MRRVLLFALALLFAGAANAFAQSAYDPKPWLDDLAQMHDAFGAGYANFEWAVFDHEVDLTGLFADTQKRIETANSDADARAAFDRLVRRIGDGHVELQWPQHGATAASAPPLPCTDYDAVRAAKPLAAYARSYVAIETPQSDVFPIGVIASGKHRVGAIKIRLFSPSGFPAICQAALTALAIPADKPCDDACTDRIDNWAAARLNEDFIAQLESLKRAKIDTLLVDIAGNGGGTEWAEAAARMVTPIRLKSARMDFMRGPHWMKELGDLESDLRKAATGASPADSVMLLKFADEAAAKEKVAAIPCDAEPLWQGKHPDCSWLGEGFFATGPMASADPATLRGKPWAARVFTPMEYQYTEGIWRGPLIVLVDGGSGSASEEFAALLQDNRAALIMGEPTYGVGCGHTDGGTPTTLLHSRAILDVPDCVRRRADGREESSVVPDVLVGFGRPDGPHLRADAFLAALPEALRMVKYPLKSNR
jgi:hypothetical protein